MLKRTEKLSLNYTSFKLLGMLAEQPTPTKEICKVTSSNSLSTVVSDSAADLVFKKYTKITNQIKEDFLDLIINRNCSIKRAAE